MIEFL